MYPAPFEYQRATSLPEALRLLATSGGEAKLLAGGHSLLPVMKMRLAAPARLIDIGRLPELTGIRLEGERLVVGALTTYREVEGSELVRRHAPLLAEAAAQVGDVQVRNRGTVGGNLAHADPASDLPAVAQALEATLRIASPRGARDVSIGDFLLGPLVTALEPDEILQEIRFAAADGQTGSSYVKFAHPASGYAVVGVACTLRLSPDGRCERVRIGVTGAAPVAYRARGVEDALEGKGPEAATIEGAADRAAEGVDLLGDTFASPEYRGHLVKVITRQTIARAASRAARAL